MCNYLGLGIIFNCWSSCYRTSVIVRQRFWWKGLVGGDSMEFMRRGFYLYLGMSLFVEAGR